VPPALARAVEARLPAGVVIQLWGMSELQAGSYGRPDDSASIRHETAGRAAPDMQLQVKRGGFRFGDLRYLTAT
jgi:hypothetical protein